MLLQLTLTNFILSLFLLYKRGSRIHIESIDGRRYLVKPIKSKKKSVKLLSTLNNANDAKKVYWLAC